MNDASQQMHDWLGQANANRAASCLTWLRGHLESGLFDGAGPLRDAIAGDVDAHLRLFANSPQMCKAIEQAAVSMRVSINHHHKPNDVRLVQTVAATYSVLTLAAREAAAPPGTISAIDIAHESTLRQALALSSKQVTALCSFLIEIYEFLRGLAVGKVRIVLVEMPSGNSVPVKLLARLLRGAANVEIIRASLSRKSPSLIGLSRRALLAEHLKTADLAPNDIVVYLDEWETGSNFKTICEFIRKELPTGVFFLPAAFQTSKAAAHERYKSFCDKHDKLIFAWGVEGHRFRRLLPPLPSSLGGGYFFWSEHDRTAGYRKMQLHGSMFSSIDETVCQLQEDEEARRAAVNILLGEVAAKKGLPGSPAEGISATLSLFEDAYQDYLQCRDELRRCADDYAKGGVIDDFDDAMGPLLERYGQILEHREAKLAVYMAAAFMHRVGALDPADRYMFDDHAPVLVELTGPAGDTHRIVMQVMEQRLRDILAGGHGPAST